MIDYPVDNMPVIIIGKPKNWTRIFNIAPPKQGDYHLVVTPKDFLRLEHIKVYEISYPVKNFKPCTILIEFKSRERIFKNWEWKLVPVHKLRASPPAIKRESLSSIVFRSREIASGRITLGEKDNFRKHKIVVWSCNQPFDTNSEDLPVLNETVQQGLFDWYAEQVKSIDPSIVWALGDTAYSDGTTATNFIDSYYKNSHSLINQKKKQELLTNYRKMYVKHWSFKGFQQVTQNYPHLSMWDDHEIRDGWGSENEDHSKFSGIIKEIATRAANEFTLNLGPRINPIKNINDHQEDGHQAYIVDEIAAFIFDGRNSRRYNDPGGKVISNNQLGDFANFCEMVASKKELRFLILGSAVPLINLKDFIENIISKSPKIATDLIGGIRDDVRDSWHSPGNIGQLKQIIQILKKLHRQNSKIEMLVVSGDIHVANLYAFQPPGFSRALYQVTTSALSNREHPPDKLNELVTVGTQSWSEALGLIARVWPTISDPNFLFIQQKGLNLSLNLRIFTTPEEGSENGSTATEEMTYEIGKHRFSFEHLMPI